MKVIQPLLYAVLISIGIYIGSGNNSTNTIVKSKLTNILEIINEHYVDSVQRTSFENKTINTILNELDPHSSYISIDDFKSVEENMNGSFSGIGVEFNIINDSIVVISPISGGPSEKIGIRSGDRIVSVEDENVASVAVKNEKVVELLRGQKGTLVNVKIKRRGQKELISFGIIRNDIPIISVNAGIILQNDIGLIKITRFAATTYNEMIKKVEKLKIKGMKKLILDFRGNPGGYLHIANQICDEFLKDGELIVFTEGRNRAKQETFATKKGSLEDIAVICLIDEGSASASEIVSGAIQDNDRGLIIGRRSFGKGLVQEQIRLNDGSVMRLTTQRYYTPSGRCIQKDYGENSKEYYLEQYSRTDDSINQDTLKYKTKNGRIVYGGGGITPDILIKLDSNVNYLYINKMLRKGWINEFCFEKSEKIKNSNITNFKQLNLSDIQLSFNKYIFEKTNKEELQLGSIELKYLKNMLLATISRNIWGEDMYYKVKSLEDAYIQNAIKEFENTSNLY